MSVDVYVNQISMYTLTGNAASRTANDAKHATEDALRTAQRKAGQAGDAVKVNSKPHYIIEQVLLDTSVIQLTTFVSIVHCFPE